MAVSDETENTKTKGAELADAHGEEALPSQHHQRQQQQRHIDEKRKEQAEHLQATTIPSIREGQDPDIPYSIFNLHEKRLMVFIVTFASLFSPISSSIYYPALTALGEELRVSDTLMNLTVTSFMILQGLAPAFIGAFSDTEGRRPAYLICFVVYIGANIGLALQRNYVALLVLRCLQSAGSSGTIAIASAVVADISTADERGRWMGWANAGGLLGPAIGPIIGGLLTHFLGWRSIFWFLTIFAGVYLLFIVCLFPETCRAVVGNGSQRPNKPWSICLLDPLLRCRIDSDPSMKSPAIPPHKFRFPNPIKTLAILFDKEASLILFSTGFLFAGFYALMAIIPYQLERRYGFDSLHVGLFYISMGGGASISALFTGRMVDYNFRRYARKLGFENFSPRHLRALATFPIEQARIQIALPLIILGTAFILAFGWTLHFHIHIAAPCILSFGVGYCSTGAFTVLATLTVDLYPDKPATATAASNMTRCWLGAGATVGVVEVVEAIGMGWCFTIVAGVWIGLSVPLMTVVRLGMGWREEKEEKTKRQEAENV